MMGVPTSPSGRDPLDVRTKLPPLNQENSEGRSALFSGLWIFLYSPRLSAQIEKLAHRVA